MTGGSGFIGTNLIDDALALGHTVSSIDIRPPAKPAHRGLWRRLDVTDAARVCEFVAETAPTAVVHLAARTDTNSTDVNDYAVNVDGTQHIAEAASKTPEVKRLVHASTQYVHTLGKMPASDVDFAPFTAYGESKVRSERILRESAWPYAWTVLRPTNIWGPWHPRYPDEFWRVLARGLYVHPRGGRVKRAYGYVGNVTAQILALLKAPEDVVDQRVFYVGDEAVWLDEWVDAFSVALRGRPARRAPLLVLRALAKAGDAATRLGGVKAPLTTSRLQNMTEEHVVPMGPTLRVCGPPPHSMLDGVAATVAWLRDCAGYPPSS